MKYSIKINIPISREEVPDLREIIRWDRRDNDYPTLFERCIFLACVRDEKDMIIAFG
ncbi:hypothetical protein ACSVDA_20810 [Cytobacillus sp. Hm23]